MRFRRKLGVLRLLYWCFWPAVLTIGLLRRGHPFGVALLAGAAVLLLFLPGHLLWFWEILPDRLLHRRYWNTVVFPFTEIAYVGPGTDPLARNPRLSHWIEVRTHDGTRMIVDTADQPAFLAAMQARLPEATQPPAI